MCASCASTDLPTGGPGVIVIAHRGDSKQAPENTLAAFERATHTGAAYVELDARASADGTLWVLHDATLDRTTNAVRVLGKAKVRLKEVHDAQIAELDAGNWYDERFAGERVPTLAAALDTIQANSRTLLEHKDGAAEPYARLLREKQLVGKLMVQSFDWDFLTAMHKLEPRQPITALGEKPMDASRWSKLRDTGARIAAWKFQDLDAKLVAEFHGRGYKVWAWTPDKAEDWDRLIEYGVEGIITNLPRELVDHLREKKAESEQ